jgi:hypothetical protein
MLKRVNVAAVLQWSKLRDSVDEEMNEASWTTA